VAERQVSVFFNTKAALDHQGSANHPVNYISILLVVLQIGFSSSDDRE
jgi:hypothetical protein